MRLIKWPSIEQYRNVVRRVKDKAAFVGLDDNGDPIFNRTAVAPKLTFEGTVKLHGTNAAVVVSSSEGFWTQSRENIITVEKDNAGFAVFAHSNRAVFEKMAKEVDVDGEVVIYGEWCGAGIQKGVAISQLPKMFVIFAVATVVGELKTYLSREDVCRVVRPHKYPQIHLIYDFITWHKEIDFENPELHQNDLGSITEAVESECPVGKELGAVGVGEGVVWRCVTPGYEDSGFWFKVKGSKHAGASKVKTLATVDVERINSINELAEAVANVERLEQMHQIVFNTLNGGETDIKKMGDFIKAVMGDIFKEETDRIVASGLTGKELSGPICKICRGFINSKL